MKNGPKHTISPKARDGLWSYEITGQIANQTTFSNFERRQTRWHVPKGAHPRCRELHRRSQVDS
jgi:hypothetical protein